MFLRATRRWRKRRVAAGTAGAAGPVADDCADSPGERSPTAAPFSLAVGGSAPPPATMRSLTVEMVRMLVRITLANADEITPETAKSLEYCLKRMEKYARDDWDQIRDLQPLLLALGRPRSNNA